MSSRLGRWAGVVTVLVAGTLILAACTSAKSDLPAAAPAPPPAPPAASGAAASPAAKPSGSPAADWATILAEARREGVVECACPPRPAYAKLFKEHFARAYPDIRLEANPATL